MKVKPIFQNISLTLISETIVLISFFCIYRLIAKNFGPEGVGEYSLVKRIIGFLQPVLLLGLNVGIPRYIAMSQDKNQRNSYIKAGGLTITFFTFILLIFINLFKDHFTKIFFGTTDYTNLILPFSFFLASLTLHALIYSYFRGRLLVKTFNILQVINLAIVPIGILIIFKRINIEQMITLMGVATFIISFIFSLFFIKELFIPIERWRFTNSLKEFLHYSFTRFMASFVYAGLLYSGPIFAAHFASIREVGYLSVGQSLLSTTGVVVASIGLILIPKVSNLISQNRGEEIKENLNYLIGATIQCSIFIFFQLVIFTDTIIKY